MKITIAEWLHINSYKNAHEALEEYSEMDDVFQAICSEDCHVEPDGHCPHSAPSPLLALGVT